LGRFDDVLREAPAIRAWGETHSDAFVRLGVSEALTYVQIDRGGDETDPVELASLSRLLGYGYLLVYCGLLALERGELETANSLLHEARSDLDPGIAFDTIRLAVALDELELARPLATRPSSNVPSKRASLLAGSAVLAEYDRDFVRARDLYRSAANAYSQLGLLPGQALSLTGAGRCLLATGPAADAAIELHRARELWSQMGATRRLAEVDNLLDQGASDQPESASDMGAMGG
jgi:hypothetical protein